MDPFAALIADIMARVRQMIAKLIGRFEVATVTPDFTVYLNGSTEAKPGLKVAGLTYSVGTVGVYLHRQGQLPLCIPTA